MLFPQTPEELQQAIAGKWEDNEQFVVEIQPIPLTRFNKLFWHLFEQTEKQVDCTRCANCCKVFHAGLPETEIKRLATLKQMK